MKKESRQNSKNNHQDWVNLDRALSKLGFCSRSQAPGYILDGRVKVNKKIQSNPFFRVNLFADRIEIDGELIEFAEKVYLMLNKPRGLVTTRSDEKGRATVFECLKDKNLPQIMPVGRLDMASEGLLLFTNDSQWANQILEPQNHVLKTYHVQIDRLADENLLRNLQKGGMTPEGDFLNCKAVKLLRSGKRNSWLEIKIDEGKNRHIRRLCAILGLEVHRLIRVAIGSLELGKLGKGEIRYLNSAEKEMLFR